MGYDSREGDTSCTFTAKVLALIFSFVLCEIGCFWGTIILDQMKVLFGFNPIESVSRSFSDSASSELCLKSVLDCQACAGLDCCVLATLLLFVKNALMELKRAGKSHPSLHAVM